MTKAEIIWVRSLVDRKARRESGLFVAEGGKLVGDLLAAGMRARRIFATEDFPNSEHVTSKEMERISFLRTPTPLLALIEIPTWELSVADLKGDLVLALDGVQDPGNLGTIVRTADWLGIRDILCSPDSADCFNPKVVQATMGALTNVRLHYGPLEQWAEAFERVYGTFLEGENLYEAPLSPTGLIVMGSEGRGISESVARRVTDKLFIPPHGRPASESLNVATATAGVCSEFRRRGLTEH